jgi:hypothetical protein
MGISPIGLTWLAREQARARIKALKDAAEFRDAIHGRLMTCV